METVANHRRSVQRKLGRILACAAISLALYPRLVPAEPPHFSHFLNLPSEFTELEPRSGGRLGIAILDTSSGEMTGLRANERFAMCSTFKALLVAAVLQRVDEGTEKLERKLRIPAGPLISNSPLTEPHGGGEMTVSALCHAAITRSDNTAANLLLAELGGPAGLTAFARSIGDAITRLDRTETDLNEAKPGDPRDTTTPAAMAEDLRKLLLGKILSQASRDQLTAWMVESQTGLERLRASVPSNWRAADKTGSNLETTSNDIAVFWPKGHAPIVVTAYLTECPGPEKKRSEILAGVGRQVVAAFQAL